VIFMERSSSLLINISSLHERVKRTLCWMQIIWL